MTGPLLLLDTDVVSLMGRRRPPPGLRPWLLSVGLQRLCISFPTITELLRGAHLLTATNPEKAAAISQWVGQVLATDFVRLDMSPGAAAIYAEMTSVPALRSMWTVQRGEKANRLGHDLMIASVAIAHRAVILTANTRDYIRIDERFPLPGVFNPVEGRWHVQPAAQVPLPMLDRHEPDPHEALLPHM